MTRLEESNSLGKGFAVGMEGNVRKEGEAEHEELEGSVASPRKRGAWLATARHDYGTTLGPYPSWP